MPRQFLRRWYRLDLFAALDRLYTLVKREPRAPEDGKPVYAKPDLSPLEFRNPPSEMIFSVVLPLAVTAADLAAGEHLASAQAAADKHAADNAAAAASLRPGSNYDTSPQGRIVGAGGETSGEESAEHHHNTATSDGFLAHRSGLDGLDGWSGSVQDFGALGTDWLPIAAPAVGFGGGTGGGDGRSANSSAMSEGSEVSGNSFNGIPSSGATNFFGNPMGAASDGAVGTVSANLSPTDSGGRIGAASRGAALRPEGSDQPMFLGTSADAPVRFIANAGQWDSSVDFAVRGEGYLAWFTGGDAVLALARDAGPSDPEPDRNPNGHGPRTIYDVVRLDWQGVDAQARVSGVSQLDSKSNFLLGNDPQQWQTGVAEYAEVRYANAWSGIDLVYRRADATGLAYDVRVRPGASPTAASLVIRGASGSIREDGRLVLTTNAGTELATSAPVVYQLRADGTKESRSGAYQLRQDGTIGFTVGSYDSSRELIIDPDLAYNVTLSGSGTEAVTAITADDSDNAYVVGYSTSSDFPTSAAYDPYRGGMRDAFVTKLDPSGSIVWSTYLGGTGGYGVVGEQATGVALGADGTVFVTGTTADTDFPVAGSPYQSSNAGGFYPAEAFLTKLSADGSTLHYSTYLGGTGFDFAYGVSVDRSNGEAIVTGYTESSDFPTTNAYDATLGGTRDVFVTRFNAAGSSLKFSTYFGESTDDQGNDVAVDSMGNAVVAMALSTSGLIGRFSPKGTLRYIGSDTQPIVAVAVDSRDRVYATRPGRTARYDTLASTTAYTIAEGGVAIGVDSKFRAVVVGAGEFGELAVVRYAANGSGADWSTTGPGSEVGTSVAVDSTGDIYVGGYAGSDAVVLKYGPPPPPTISTFTDDTGAANNDRVTYDTTPTLAGTAAPNSTVTVYRKGPKDPRPVAGGTTTATAGGLWTFTYGSALEAGRYQFSATATVNSATSASSALLSATIDTTQPEVVVRVDAQTYDRQPAVLVTVKDLVGFSGANVILDADLDNDGNFTDPGEAVYAQVLPDNGMALFTGYAALTVGNTVRFRASILDLAGNQGISAAKTVQVVSTVGAWTATDLTWRTRSGHDLLSSGDVTAYHALDLDKSPFATDYQDPYFVYHSQEAAPAPVVQAALLSDNALGIPLHVYGTLTWDGAQVGGVDYSLSGLSPGGEWVFAYAPTGTPATGRHTYSLNLFVDYTGTANDRPVTITGDTFVVNRSSSPYGAGWSYSNTDALVTIASSGSYPAGVLRLHGEAGWSFYVDAGSGQYTEPAGDTGSLVASGGTWTYTSTDGRVLKFDSSGRMTSRQDLASTETLTYTYDGAGTGTAARVATVTHPDGGVATFAYSGSLLSTITAPGSRVTTFAYTGSDLTQVTNPAAGAHTFTYSSSRLTGETYGAANVTYAYNGGQASSMTWGAASTIVPAFKAGIGTGVTAGPAHSAPATFTDALSNPWKSWFNAFGQPVRTLSPIGAMDTFERNANGFVTKYIDARESATTYTVDSAGRVTNEARPDGTSASWVYGGAYGSLTKYTDYRGGVYTLTNDSNGNRLTLTDPLNHTTTFTYSNGLLQTVKDATNNVITYSYDASRRPTGALLGGAVTGTVGYDTAGNPNTYTDPRNNVSTLTFDNAGRVVGTINPLSQRTTISYDAGGLVKWMSDGLGHITSYAYDSAGRVSAVIEAYGTSLQRRTTPVYDAASQLTAVVDPLGNRTTAVYDEAGQTIATVDALGNKRQYFYGLTGALTDTVDELGRTTKYGYDQLDRLQTMTDALGNVTSVVYDANSNPTALVDPLGNRTSYGYDAADRLVTVTNPLNKVTSYGYDNADRFITVTDPLGNVKSAVYDSRNRVSEVIDALGKRVTFGYDAADNRITAKDPLNHVTTAVYDTLNRFVGSIDALGNRSTITYDADGKVIESIDPLNYRTTVVYDELDRAVAVVDALGNRNTAVYDAADRVTAVVDPLGNRTSHAFDAAGRVTASIDPLLNRTTFSYDAASQLIEVRNALGERTTTGYDALGRAITSTDSFGSTWTTAYDTAGRIVSSTDPNNHTDTIVYDNASRVIAVENALGKRTSYGYDAAGNAVTMTDPLNNVTTLVYDVLNRPSALTNALNQRSTLVYDDAGNVTAYADGLNRRTTWGYDAADRQVTTTDPLGNVWTTGYDVASNVTSATDPLNHTRTLIYDEVDRVKAVVDALGNRTTATYDAAGNLRTITDALNHVTTFAYDARNMRVATTDALGNVWTTEYDAVGSLRRQVDPLEREVRFYIEGGREVDSADGLGYRDVTFYDPAGNAIANVDGLGNYTTLGYDAADRLITIRDARNGVTTVAYDAAGNTRSLTDPVGNTNTWTYDVLNRVATETDPSNANSTFAYNSAGELASTTDRLGRRKDFDYYANGQLKSEKWYASGGALTQTQTLTYDAAWRMLTAQDPDGTYTLAYDNADRVTRVDEPFGLVLTFGYDAVGNRTKVQDSKGGLATITFDNVNRQLTEELSGTNITKVKETRAYTAAGELSLVTRQTWSGAAYATAGTTSYSYDNDFHTTNITHFGSGGAVLASYVYAYDAEDRLTSETINGALRTYSYDATDQLTTDAGTVYSYDLNGNRNMSGYATGAANRVTTDGTWTYTYDAEGNITKRSKGASSDTWNYTYDHNNQMLTASFSATDGGAATTRVTFAYDAFSNKLQRQAWSGSTTTERYGYDGWDPAKPPALANENFDAWIDLDGSNALTIRRLHGPGFDDLTLREDSTGTVGWYLTDLLGSVRGVTNGSGTPLTTITYTGWGSVISNSTPAQSDRFQYESAVSDGTLGLRDHRGRATNGWTWFNEDPIGFAAGDTNLRRVEGNGPTNWRDPSGLAVNADSGGSGDNPKQFGGVNSGGTADNLLYVTPHSGAPTLADSLSTLEWHGTGETLEDALETMSGTEPSGLQTQIPGGSNGPQLPGGPGGPAMPMGPPQGFSPWGRKAEDVKPEFVRGLPQLEQNGSIWIDKDPTSPTFGSVFFNSSLHPGVLRDLYQSLFVRVPPPPERPAPPAPPTGGTPEAPSGPSAGSTPVPSSNVELPSAEDIKQGLRTATEIIGALSMVYSPLSVLEAALELIQGNPNGAALAALGVIPGFKHLRKAVAETRAAAKQGFSVGRHADMPSPRPGKESHHGVMSAWMERQFPKYNADKAPAVLMPKANHHATFGVYQTWRKEMKEKMGGTFDWNKVSEAEMKALSEKMFDAGKVPKITREQYWAWYKEMIKALRK